MKLFAICILAAVPALAAEPHKLLVISVDGMDARFLKARTLWQEALAQKRKVATVYWPVTLGAEVDFNFPEFWESRSEHELLFEPIAKRATKGLEERVTRIYPSFPKSRFDDLTAMQAARYLLEYEKPDLLLVHIPDLDSESARAPCRFPSMRKPSLSGRTS